MSVLSDDKIAYSMGFANAQELREFIVWPTDFFDSVRAAIATDRATRAEPVELSRIQRTAPERIWLQVDPDIDAADTDFHDQDEVTWADDDIGENDVPYVRVDLAAAPVVPEGWIAAVKDLRKEAAFRMCGFSGEGCIDSDRSCCMSHLRDAIKTVDAMLARNKE